MKLYVLPPSPRAFKVIALKNHLGLECETQVVDLAHDAHLTAAYGALNPNRKMPVLDDDGFVFRPDHLHWFFRDALRVRGSRWIGDSGVLLLRFLLHISIDQSCNDSMRRCRKPPSAVFRGRNGTTPATARTHPSLRLMAARL